MPRPKTPAADYERFVLRVPQRLMAVIREQAETLGRPINTHLVRLLEKAVARDISTPKKRKVAKKKVVPSPC